MRWQTYVPAATAAIVVAGGVVLVLLQQRCLANGGTFEWTRAACERDRPVILQGDIHRV
jgi:hypothetical protein